MTLRTSTLPIALVGLAGLAQTANAQCPPNAPHSLVASQAVLCNGVTLNWPDVSGANHYSIYRSTSNSYASSRWIGTALFGSSQYLDQNVAQDTYYYYWVTASHTLCLPGSTESGPSNAAAGWTAQAPVAPDTIHASNGTTCNGVRVTWGFPQPPLGAEPTSFTIYRNTINLYLTSSSVGTVSNGDVRAFMDYSAVPNTVYYYWVRAENVCSTAHSDGASGFCNQGTPPPNNACADAIPVGNGTYFGSTSCANSDGASNCALTSNAPDIWYRYTAPTGGTLVLDTCVSSGSFDTVLSVHSGSPGTAANTLACNDNYCNQQSRVSLAVVAGRTYYIRVAGEDADSGAFALHVNGPGGCYPNCDLSTTSPSLNVLDFSCFLNKFAAGDPYANCDQSTTPPVLNVLDFSCFLNAFAAGCSQ